MMARLPAPGSPNPYQSPYPLLKEWARHAPAPVLWRLLGFPAAAAALIVGLAPGFWPIAVLSGVAMCTALWGLVDLRVGHRPSRGVRFLQVGIVLLGTLCALAGAAATFLFLLGPRWNL